MPNQGKYTPKLGFDIRVKPPSKKKKSGPVTHLCAWPGCKEKGPHKAPKGRDKLNEYQYFCVNHIREFNANWNFFEGMTEKEVRAFQESLSTGHRPTWKVGTGPGQAGVNPMDSEWIDDPMKILGDGAGGSEPRRPQRKLPKQVKDAFFTMNLDPNSSPEKIKTRYKELVKKFHPDANLGQKGYEERLKRIIEAYTSLKTAGFC